MRHRDIQIGERFRNLRSGRIFTVIGRQGITTLQCRDEDGHLSLRGVGELLSHYDPVWPAPGKDWGSAPGGR